MASIYIHHCGSLIPRLIRQPVSTLRKLLRSHASAEVADGSVAKFQMRFMRTTQQSRHASVVSLGKLLIDTDFASIRLTLLKKNLQDISPASSAAKESPPSPLQELKPSIYYTRSFVLISLSHLIRVANPRLRYIYDKQAI